MASDPGARQAEHVVAALDRRDRLICSACAYPLAGLRRRGLCPECGAAYDVDRPLRRHRTRDLARAYARHGPRWALSRFAMTPRTAAILLLVVGNAAVLAGLAWWAWETFERAIGRD